MMTASCFPGGLQVYPSHEQNTVLTQVVTDCVASVAQGLHQSWQALFADVVQTVAPLDDEKIIEELKSDLQALQQAAQAIPQPGLDANALKKRSSEPLDIVHLANRLEQCICDTLAPAPLSKQMTCKILVGLTFLSSALPLAVARIQGNNQYFGLLVAGYTKTLLVLLGLVSKSRINFPLVLDHFFSRHVTYFAPTLPYGLALCAPRLLQFSKQFPLPFALIAGVFVGLVYVFSARPDLLSKPANALWRKLKDAFSSLNKKASLNTNLHTATEQNQFASNNVGTSFQDAHNKFVEQFQNFHDSSGALKMSDSLNFLLSEVSAASQSLLAHPDLMASSVASSSCRTSISKISPAAINQEYARRSGFTKWSLAIVSAMLCLLSAATYYDEPIGLVDVGTDAGYAIFKMVEIAKDPSATVQRSIESFVNFSGLAPLLLVYGVLNKLFNFTDTTVGFVVGTAALSLTNLTLPRLLATAICRTTVHVSNRLAAIRCGHPELDVV